MSEDPRYRTKLYIETYDTPADITNDADTAQALILNRFEKDPTPLSRVFFSPKNYDGIRTIGTPTLEGLPDWKHENYAYREIVPIELSAVNKQGITADKLRWKMEADLRSTVDNNPLGSVRLIRRGAPVDRDEGRFRINTVRYDLDYKRAVEDYTSDVNITYGSGFQYDGLRKEGGPEGTWAETEDGSTGSFDVTTEIGTLCLNATLVGGNEAYYVTSGTALNLNSSVYTRIRLRGKTSNSSVKAKVILHFTVGSQTVLADVSSTTWNYVDVPITSGKTITYIELHADHGTGIVYYGSINIYKDIYVIPNVLNNPFEATSRNVNLGIPGSIAIGWQNLGADSSTFELECDTDIQTSETAGVDGCWLRSGDSDKEEVFLDIMHNQSISAPWQWLTFGNKGMKVQLDSVRHDPFNGRLYIRGHEYSDNNRINETYNERWSL